MSGDWSDVRLEVAYGEARSVIEAQRDVISDIDDESTRTVRLNAIVVGIVVGAAQLAGASVFHFPVLTGGTCCSFLSLGGGLITYRESDLYLGANRAYIERIIAHEFDESSWETDLLIRMADWI